jgi:hypothetical protein
MVSKVNMTLFSGKSLMLLFSTASLPSAVEFGIYWPAHRKMPLKDIFLNESNVEKKAIDAPNRKENVDSLHLKAGQCTLPMDLPAIPWLLEESVSQLSISR